MVKLTSGQKQLRLPNLEFHSQNIKQVVGGKLYAFVVTCCCCCFLFEEQKKCSENWGTALPLAVIVFLLNTT